MADAKVVERKVRARAAHFLTPEVASLAGLSLDQLKRVPYGGQRLTPKQVEALARRMSIPGRLMALFTRKADPEPAPAVWALTS